MSAFLDTLAELGVSLVQPLRGKCEKSLLRILYFAYVE